MFLMPTFDRILPKMLVHPLWAFWEAHVVGLGVCFYNHLSPPGTQKELSASGSVFRRDLLGGE